MTIHVKHNDEAGYLISLLPHWEVRSRYAVPVGPALDEKGVKIVRDWLDASWNEIVRLVLTEDRATVT
jgi:hypothetical protein